MEGRAVTPMMNLRMARTAVHLGGTVITRAGADVRWWTWAGYRANATLAAMLSEITDEKRVEGSLVSRPRLAGRPTVA